MRSYDNLTNIHIVSNTDRNQITGSDFVGIVFTIDLIFTVSDAIDFTTGFNISFPQGASFVINPLSGDLVQKSV